MKKLTLALPLLVLAAFTLTARPADSDHFQIQLYGDETQTAAAVTLHGIKGADFAIVEFSYWQSVSGIPGPLLRHTVDVVPGYMDIGLATASVPVSRQHVKSVTVTVVKSVETHSEQFNQGDAK